MIDMSFRGKRVVLTGGATGVGAALLDTLAELGATDVTVLDVKEPTGPHATYLSTDLSDRGALDASIDAIDGTVDVLVNNAGVADTSTRDTVLRVNLLAPLHLTEALLPQIPDGGTIVSNASIAGMAWRQRLPELLELLALEGGWDARWAWLDGRELGAATYAFTKEAIQVWTMRSAAQMNTLGVRINSVCPAPIDTALLPDFRATMGDAGIDFTVANTGGRPVSPQEVAHVIAWLASPASSFVSGQNLNIDLGFEGSMTTGQLDMSSMRR